MKDKDKDKRLAGGTPTCNRLPDGSISWEQPDSNGMGGWEGFCGQTATANLLTTYTGNEISPHDVAEAANDWGPGSTPATLLRAIQALVPDGNQYFLSDSQDLSSATRQTPIVCLLYWSGLNFHYVTVVEARPNSVLYNHWGTRGLELRDKFDELWSFQGAGAQIIAALGGVRGFTSIRRR